MNVNRPLCILCWISALALSALVLSARGDDAPAEKLPDGLNVVSIAAHPQAVELKHKFDYRQVLVTGKLDTGEIVDLTRIAKPSQSGGAVTVSNDGLVRAKADGSDQVTFTFAGHTVAVPVTVSGFTAPHTVSYVRDVQPALSRMGCNAGTCHGAKEGKAGFKLSLRGYDALYDHRAFTDDIGGRRFNRSAPDQSLMLLKATGSIPHVGGVRTTVDHPYYTLVRDWISQGVKLDLAAPRVSKIEVLPVNPTVPRPGMKQQVTVMATYADGLVRDVTREAFIESGNIEIIEANTSGVLTTLRRGEAPVLVRYEGAYAATTIVVMGDRTGFAWEQKPQLNYIDQLVDKKLQQVKILPSDLCTDEDFVRRVYIDLTGLPPTSEQTKAFLALPGESRAKRDALVDQLVGSREYVEHWTNKWADLLQVNRKFLGEEGSIALRNWIKESIATNKPYDKMAYEVLTARGSNLDNPPAAYWKVLRDPTAAMENTTHLFLAVRFNCNKCHDHPFERWTQDQYYQLSQYFAQVGRKPLPEFAGQNIGGSAVEGAVPLVEAIYDTGSGDVKHDRTGQVVPPLFPYAHGDQAPAEAARREQLARWITSKDNQYFAKSYVNRLWGYLFGPGIIEPIDDIRAGNPATNPELLDALTKDFVASGFDAQHILRTICKSRTYQASVATNQWNEDDTINYSHAIPRRLPAEVLYDAIHMAAGATQRLPGVPAGFRAAELPDAGISDAFLEDFGKPVRESACECERSSGMVLGPIMKLVNGPTVANALADGGSDLNKLATSEPDDKKLIEEVFIRFLARKPTEKELTLGVDALQAAAAEQAKAAAALAEYEKTIPAKLAAWEASIGKPLVWTPLDPSELKSAVGATLARQDDKSVVATGTTGKDVYSFVAPTDLKGITAIRLEAIADPALAAGGPGRAQNGNFVVSELKLSAAPKADPAKAEAIGLANASADFSQDGWHVSAAIDGSEDTGWAVSPQFGKTHTAIFETKTDVAHDGGSVLTLTISQQFPDGMHLLGKFRISVTDAKRPVMESKLPEAIAAALAVPADKRTPEQAAALAAHYRSLDGELARLTAEVGKAADAAKNARQIGVQDLAWALINSPAFLFNR
ncbi:MAG: DUF1549 and DUF1553 domain-containing protein [Planctomycetaceae bacterium]|nr:DUF1549 and DUF1553 domain-containing protein [Planctomycetaceae bacterium]